MFWKIVSCFLHSDLVNCRLNLKFSVAVLPETYLLNFQLVCPNVPVYRGPSRKVQPVNSNCFQNIWYLSNTIPAYPVPCWLIKEKNTPHSVCETIISMPCIRVTQSSPPTMRMSTGHVHLQLSLLHSNCLTCFYPSRIPDSEQSLLSASPSTLMPMLCLYQKKKPPLHPTIKNGFSVHITKKLPQ